MWGHQPAFRRASDVDAIHLLTRYAHRVARRVILQPTSSPIRDLRGVLAPSFYCRPRVITFDQTSQPVELEGIDSDGRPATIWMGAALLRLEVWPIRVQVLNRAGESLDSGGAAWEKLGGESLTRGKATAAAEAWLTAGEKGEPHLAIHLRNRQAAEPLLRVRQRIQRRILDLHQQRPETSFLRVRSIYVGERSTDDDLMAQIVLAVLQAGVVSQDSSSAEWFREYLLRFLSARAKRADGVLGAEAAIIAFAGLWKNAGNAEFAPAWRRYVKAWVRCTERQVMPHSAVWLQSDGDRTDDDGRDPDDRDRHRKAAAGALSPNRKVRREVFYAVPVEGDRPPERLSVKKVADALGVSRRQVFRLVNAGRIRPLQRDPMLFDPADVSELLARRTGKRAERHNRMEAIQHLIRSRGLTYQSARKKNYRNRKRTD